MRLSLRPAAALAAMIILTMPAVAPAAAQSSPSTDAAKFIASEAPSEMRVAKLIGVPVQNNAGETVGGINDVVLQANGQAVAIVIGVGGFLGMGEKNVAVPYSAVAITTAADGTRSAVVNAAKAALMAAPAYISERTIFEKVQDGASDMATTAKKKAIEIKEKMSAPAAPPAQQPK